VRLAHGPLAPLDICPAPAPNIRNKKRLAEAFPAGLFFMEAFAACSILFLFPEKSIIIDSEEGMKSGRICRLQTKN